MKAKIILFILLVILFSPIPKASSQQPATSNQQPAARSQEPATSNQQPATRNQQPAASFGKGINIIAKDSSMSFKFRFRMQTRFEIEQPLAKDSLPQSQILVRRARLLFDGFAFSPNLIYKVELGLTSKDIGFTNDAAGNVARLILDAVLQWRVYKNLWLWFGQTKLPGNREFVISSQKLQFVDLSRLSDRFNINRDAGFQIRHHFKIGSIVTRNIYSLSMGEGRNVIKPNKGGYDYTVRLELLPFGEFTEKGDYFSSDMAREEKPKLSLSATYDFNDGATRQGGQIGEFTPVNTLTGKPFSTDLTMLLADMMFKYKGISIMAEYVDRAAPYKGVVDVTSPTPFGFYTGIGQNVQAGYLFKNNFEIAARYTHIMPANVFSFKEEKEYTLVVSKYIKDHNLKIQSDITLIETKNITNPILRFRFQVEMAF